MTWDRRTWTVLAALSGLVSVAAGAFGAHGAADPAAKELLRTGASYEASHALAVLACAALPLNPRRAAWPPALFLFGALVFSGSLYAMAFGAPRWLGAITPIGGLSLMGGWACLAYAAAGAPQQSPPA